jgi:iron complex outermembrane receptor protein
MGALSVMSTPVFAEESGRQIEEVIVTAERREASIQDTSISITAFTGEMLDDFGIRNQEDLQLRAGNDHSALRRNHSWGWS